MDPIRPYLTNGTFPADTKEAERVKKRAVWFTIDEAILYKCSYAWPLLHCVTLEMGKKILEKIHEGVCSLHIRGRALAIASIRTRYYWPSLREDVIS